MLVNSCCCECRSCCCCLLLSLLLLFIFRWCSLVVPLRGPLANARLSGTETAGSRRQNCNESRMASRENNTANIETRASIAVDDSPPLPPAAQTGLPSCEMFNKLIAAAAVSGTTAGRINRVADHVCVLCRTSPAESRRNRQSGAVGEKLGFSCLPVSVPT